MKKNILNLALLLFTIPLLFSCEFMNEWGDYTDSYAPCKVVRVEAAYDRHNSDNIYFEYDRSGRVLSIENSYDGRYDEFRYDNNKDIIYVAGNTSGEERDIELNYSGYAKNEAIYYRGKLRELYSYNYSSRKISKLVKEEYNTNSYITAQEEYTFKYDYNGNLTELYRFYDKENFTSGKVVKYSNFTNYQNNYNLDILSIIGNYIDGDFSSFIGIAGGRSTYLPSRMVVTHNLYSYNEYNEIFSIDYYMQRGYITEIYVTSNQGNNINFYITYK